MRTALLTAWALFLCALIAYVTVADAPLWLRFTAVGLAFVGVISAAWFIRIGKVTS